MHTYSIKFAADNEQNCHKLAVELHEHRLTLLRFDLVLYIACIMYQYIPLMWDAINDGSLIPGNYNGINKNVPKITNS